MINYSYLEQISMDPTMFEPLRFDCFALLPARLDLLAGSQMDLFMSKWVMDASSPI